MEDRYFWKVAFAKMVVDGYAESCAAVDDKEKYGYDPIHIYVIKLM